MKFSTILLAMSLKSVELYSNSVEYIMKRSRLIGLGMFDKGFKTYNFLVAFLCVDLTIYTLVTIYCCFLFSDDLEKLIFNLVTYGFASQVSLKSSIIILTTFTSKY